MAKIKLTPENLEALNIAIDKYFPKNGYFDGEFTYGKLTWSGLPEFLEDLSETTNLNLEIGDRTIVPMAKAALQKNFEIEQAAEKEKEKKNEAEEKTPEEIEKAAEANIADKAKREAMEAERQRREQAVKEAAAKAKQEVEASIKRQQEIHNELKGKKIYRKIEMPNEGNLSGDNAIALKTLQESAQQNPSELTDQLSKEIQQRIKTSTPNGVDDEVANLSKQAALRVVQNLRGESMIAEAVSAHQLASSNNILDNLDIDSAYILQNSAVNVGDTRLIEYQIDRKIVTSAFGEDFAANFLGPKNVDNIKVQFSETPQPGFEEFELSQVTGDQLELLQHQDFVYDSIENYSSGEIKSVFLRQVGTWIESKIPAEGAVNVAYNSKVVQAAFSYYGLGEPVVWEGTTFFGRLAIQTGNGNLFGWAGQITGVDFGVTQASASIATEVAAEAATTAAVTGGGTAVAGSTGAAVATGTAVAGAEAAVAGGTAAVATGAASAATGAAVAGGTAAGGAAAGAAAGSAVPVVGTIIGAVLGAVLGSVAPAVIKWVSDKYNKNKEMIVAIPAALMVGFFSGPIAGLAAGVGSFGIMSALNGKIPITNMISGAVSSLVGVFSAIWATFLGAVGGPIVAILIGLPVFIVLVLVIINNGAYVVPPNLDDLLNNTNPYIQVEKVASPEGPFENTDLPVTITYTVTVTAKTSTLTSIRFKNECQIVTSGAGGTCPAETPPAPESISPGSPFVFTYEETYSGTKYKDSIVNDTFTVSANSVESVGIETSGGASVTIGEPPTGCLSINQAEWPSGAYSNIVAARSTLLAKYSNYVSKVCLSYPDLPLKFNPSSGGGYWGWNRGTYIDFYGAGVGNQANALYTLAHELGHSLAWGSKTAYIYAAYLAFPGIKSEAPYCFYSATTSWNDGESMPEAIALYVIEPRCGSVQSKYPKHYQFLQKYIFN